MINTWWFNVKRIPWGTGERQTFQQEISGCQVHIYKMKELCCCCLSLLCWIVYVYHVFFGKKIQYNTIFYIRKMYSILKVFLHAKLGYNSIIFLDNLELNILISYPLYGQIAFIININAAFMDDFR